LQILKKKVRSSYNRRSERVYTPKKPSEEKAKKKMREYTDTSFIRKNTLAMQRGELLLTHIGPSSTKTNRRWGTNAPGCWGIDAPNAFLDRMDDFRKFPLFY
jgi:hypothetical protein